MKRIDVIIAAVLVVAAVASAIGATTYDDKRLGAPFLVTWTTQSQELSADAVPHTGSGDVPVELTVDLANLTSLAFDVGVAGAGARVQPTQVLVEITGPDNQTQQAEATLAPGGPSTVTVPLEFDLGDVPTVTQVQGASPEAALAQLSSEHATTNGTGTWTIRVSLAGTAPGPLAESHTITVRATAESYAAELTTETPDVNR